MRSVSTGHNLGRNGEHGTYDYGSVSMSALLPAAQRSPGRTRDTTRATRECLSDDDLCHLKAFVRLGKRYGITAMLTEVEVIPTTEATDATRNAPTILYTRGSMSAPCLGL